jgi:predicted acyltransferase
VIKKLWTSSYVLVAGGWSFLLLALFYAVIDIGRYRTWAQPFIWIGLNPITIYMLTGLISPNALVRRVIHSDVEAAMGVYGELVVCLLGLALAVGFCYWLYRRRIFIRI